MSSEAAPSSIANREATPQQIEKGVDEGDGRGLVAGISGALYQSRFLIVILILVLTLFQQLKEPVHIVSLSEELLSANPITDRVAQSLAEPTLLAQPTSPVPPAPCLSMQLPLRATIASQANSEGMECLALLSGALLTTELHQLQAQIPRQRRPRQPQ